MAENKKAENKKAVARTWGNTMHIPAAITEEIKVFAGAGWALTSGGQPRQLTESELKLIAIVCHRTGLSVAGKQMIFLGNSLYVTKGGKVAKSRQDKKMPLARVETRPATKAERNSYGLPDAEQQEDPAKRDYLTCAEIYAKVDSKTEKVSSAFGHACVGNINLKGKERDPFRLCKDMSETRAISRALSQVYDFFGLDSYEEVAMGQPVNADYTIKGDDKTTTDNLKTRIANKADEIDPPENSDPALQPNETVDTKTGEVTEKEPEAEPEPEPKPKPNEARRQELMAMQAGPLQVMATTLFARANIDGIVEDSTEYLQRMVECKTLADVDFASKKNNKGHIALFVLALEELIRVSASAAGGQVKLGAGF